MDSDQNSSKFDQREQSVETQYNVFKYIQKHPLKISAYILCAALTFVFSYLTYVAVRRYDYDREFSAAVSKDTSVGLENFGNQVAAITQTYVKCKEAYSGREVIFSLELSLCRNDISANIKSAQDIRDKYASVVDTPYLELIDKILTQLYQDFRGVATDAWFAKSFEEDVISHFVLLCSKKEQPENKQWNSVVDRGLDSALNRASDLMFTQTVEYYTLRDFVIPRLSKAKDILTSAARSARGLGNTKLLLQAQKAYIGLIEEQGKYNPEKSAYPFLTGFLRSM